MPKVRKKRENKAKRKCDKRDAQILAAKTANPTANLREISEITGIPITSVHRRLQGIPETEEYQEAARECLALMVDAVKVYRRWIHGGPDEHGIDLRAAHQLLAGMGLFSEKRNVDVSGNLDISDPTGLGAALKKSAPGTIDAIIEFLEKHPGADTDPSPVVGEEVPPDGEGPAA